MSNQIVISKLNFSYTSAVEILKDVDLHLTAGWTGIVGTNGGGKTTLLRLLARQLKPDHDSIRYEPSDSIANYCPQQVDEITEAISDFAEDWSKLAMRLRGKLELETEDIYRWDSLSPGERKRWQIGAALADQPDVLLLDEPTNHLDQAAKNLLLTSLQQFKGVGVLVSHDRFLLDTLTNSTARVIHGGTVNLYRGSYSEAHEVWVSDDEREYETREQLKTEQRKMRKRLDVARRSQDKADSMIKAGKRLKGIHDSDGRSAAAKGKIANAESKLGREVAVLKTKLSTTSDKLDDAFIQKQVGRSVFVLDDKSPKSNLVSFKADELKAGDQSLINDVDLIIRRDSHIHLQGVNGSGKTTLIEKLIEVSNLPEDKILYLPQELSETQISDMMEEMNHLSGPVKGRLMQIVAALGVPPDRLMQTWRPSPGEARKLFFAMGLSKQAWLLLLDEPTNHLDLPSVERIEEACIAYSGAFLLVSHDIHFAGAVTNETWKIEDNRLLTS